MNDYLTYARRLFLCMVAALVALPVVASDGDDGPPPARHVIHISVDGLRADAVPRFSADELPNLYRLRTEGAHTDNARTDYYRSNTLPNHTSQLTGRAVLGPYGHHWTTNSNPDAGVTLHSNRGEYVASVFDVAHDHGLSTALYATKSKFVIFEESYNELNGAPDRTGADDGRDKIDRFLIEENSEALVDAFVSEMEREPYEYAFVHLRDPDSAGHRHNWNMRSGSSYLGSIEGVDRLLGRIFELVDTTPALTGNTVIILTSDHGGGGNFHNHGDASHIENYTIPFYVWGRGVAPTELYALNRGSRLHPGMSQPDYGHDGQPIRNGDAANLALAHLGLPPVSGSTINVAHDLRTYRMQPLRPALASDDREGPAAANREAADHATASAGTTAAARAGSKREAAARDSTDVEYDAADLNNTGTE